MALRCPHSRQMTWGVFSGFLARCASHSQQRPMVKTGCPAVARSSDWSGQQLVPQPAGPRLSGETAASIPGLLGGCPALGSLSCVPTGRLARGFQALGRTSSQASCDLPPPLSLGGSAPFCHQPPDAPAAHHFQGLR
ncbi:unnamed protein product [Rangifer tarandus platyrhynchus]|uniref:Uncharacterized protein n=2 Tax=Rangifer tarandus platyrhynchus TaxID=3082113 RepID=A0AC59ZCL8_RANTA|nr:unnamed protein product [Rangifer tarandus platyrhynchus]